MAATTTLVTVPANGSQVTLDPGTCYTALVVNTGTVRVYAAGYVGEPTLPTSSEDGGPIHDCSLLGPGQRRTIYPAAASPITGWTDSGSAGQVSVTTYPQG